ADGEPERENRRGRNSLALPDLTPSEDGIGAERIEPRKQADIAALLAELQRRAQRGACFARGAAPPARFFAAGVEVLVDFARHAFGVEEVFETLPETHI